MNKRILVVDDDARIRCVLSQLLSSRGYDVEEAADGREALRSIQSNNFDLIFLDRDMPNVSGEEVMEQLSPEFIESTPVVLLTGKDKDGDVMSGYAMGATYYITKPISNHRVLNIVDYLVGKTRGEEKDALREQL